MSSKYGTRALSRRQFVCVGLSLCSGAPLAHAFPGPEAGVVVGVASYSFRQIGFDASIAAMKEIGLTALELWDASLVPHQATDFPRYIQRANQWRLSVEQAELDRSRRLFDDAGIRVVALTSILRPQQTDAELNKVFEIAKAMGTDCVFSTTNVSIAARLNAIARAKSMKIAMHNHSVIRPDEFATPDDFSAAMKGNPNVFVNLDIGHFFAAGYDPVSYIAEHHERILGIHLKDRRKNQGPNVPFGEGDTPIREVLQLIKKNKYSIPAMIEYEYQGADPLREVRRCYEYCLKALA